MKGAGERLAGLRVWRRAAMSATDGPITRETVSFTDRRRGPRVPRSRLPPSPRRARRRGRPASLLMMPARIRTRRRSGRAKRRLLTKWPSTRRLILRYTARPRTTSLSTPSTLALRLSALRGTICSIGRRLLLRARLWPLSPRSCLPRTRIPTCSESRPGPVASRTNRRQLFQVSRVVRRTDLRSLVTHHRTRPTALPIRIRMLSKVVPLGTARLSPSRALRASSVVGFAFAMSRWTALPGQRTRQANRAVSTTFRMESRG